MFRLFHILSFTLCVPSKCMLKSNSSFVCLIQVVVNLGGALLM